MVLGIDLDAVTGEMNMDCGRERPVDGSVAAEVVAGGGIGPRREPAWEDGCFVCLVGEGSGLSEGIDGSGVLPGCGDDDRGLFVTGGGFIVAPDAGKITELLLLGAVAVVGLFAFSRPPPHKSTRSCTELCLPLLLVRRLRCPSPVPLSGTSPFAATFPSSFVFSTTPPLGIYPLGSSGPASLTDDAEPCLDRDPRLGDGAGLQPPVRPLGDGVDACLAPVPEGICNPSPAVLTSPRVTNALDGSRDFDLCRCLLSFSFSSALRLSRSRSDLPAGILSRLSSALFHSRSSSVTCACWGCGCETTVPLSASSGFASAIGLRSM